MEKESPEMILVSVIVPVYNAGKYLPACLDSIINQHLQEIEIIVVDDGSTDDSGQIADRYAAKDSRIRVIHQENAHLSAARNAGMQVAKGEYIAFIDSDDWIESDMFSSMYEVALREEADVVISGVTVEFTKENRVHLDKIGEEYTERDQMNFYSLFVQLSELCLFNYACNKLYRTRILKDRMLIFEIEAPFEDISFNLQVLKEIGTVSIIPGTYYHYIRRGEITILSSYRAGFLEAHKQKEEVLQSFFYHFEVDKALSDDYLKRMKVSDYCIYLHSLYWQNANLSRKERLRILHVEFYSSSKLKNIVRETAVEDIYQKMFRNLLLYASPWFAEFFYSCLFFFRYRMEFLYRRFRILIIH